MNDMKKNSLFLLLSLSSCFLMQEQMAAVQTVKKQFDYTYNQQMSLGGNLLISTFQTVLIVADEGYHYKPMPIQFFFNLPLLKRAKRNQLSFYLEPGIVPVILKPEGVGLQAGRLKEYRSSWEGGFHAGFLYNLLILEDLIFFAGASAGPYYFATQNDDQQHKGFLFSDNVVFGFRSRFTIFAEKYLEMLVHVRYRHLSNADFMQPNNGIDNILVGLGFSYLLQGKK